MAFHLVRRPAGAAWSAVITFTLDTGQGANWAAGGCPVSRRHGFCIIDGSDDPDAGGWPTAAPARTSLSRRSQNTKWARVTAHGTERNQR